MARIYVTASLGTNTGRATGDTRMGRPKVLILTRGKVFSAADLASSDAFKAALQAAMNLQRGGAGKCFLIDGLREAEDKTGDPQSGNLGDGYTEIINEALPKFSFKNTKGVAEQQALVSFNGWSDPVLVIDDKNVLWYRGAANNGGQGFSVGSFYTAPPKFGNTGNINTNTLELAFGEIDEFKSNVGALKLDFTAAELQNIADVKLEEAAAATGYVFKIAAKNRFSGTSIYGAYKNGLLQNGAWKVTLADGTAVVVSSVTGDDATEVFTVTLAGTPTIATGTAIYFELKDPAALAALTAPVLGIESLPLKVLKP